MDLNSTLAHPALILAAQSASGVAQASSALAALPFLPAGKGALILILGGLAVLPFSLLLSRGSRAATTTTMLASASPPGTQWAASLQAGIARLGLGPCRVMALDAQRCVVSLASCETCRRRGLKSRVRGCERERRALVQAVKAVCPQALVREVACDPLRQGTCTFEVLRRPRA